MRGDTDRLWPPQAVPAAGHLPDGTRVLGVAELTRHVKGRLEDDPLLRRVAVRGEVSNLRRHTSGHVYFTLKDARSRLRCVLFRGVAGRVRHMPADGLTVVAVGSVGVYEAGGEYQLYVEDVHPGGRGELHAAFEELKARLAAEGLFDPAAKRPLPFLPRRIGIVTSPTGAALRDMLSVLRRRFPGCQVLLSPAVVQGEEGPRSVVRALELLGRRGGVDVVVVGRGGGSLEELWTFNDERVARAIRACPVPVVSAVGHETDFTIADFAADCRAPTPSAAAELVVPEKVRLLASLSDLRARLGASAARQLRRRRERLALLSRSPALARPRDRIRQLRQALDDTTYRAAAQLRALLAGRREQLAARAAALEALSPLGTLARGYALCCLEATGEVVRTARQAPPGSRIRVRLSREELGCRVEDAAEPTQGPGDEAAGALGEGVR